MALPNHYQWRNETLASHVRHREFRLNKNFLQAENLMASGPVSRILCDAFYRVAAIIPLGRRSLGGSSSLPEGHNGPSRPSPPIWPCTTRGLPCRRRYRLRGGLLPHHFTLTCATIKKTCQRFCLWPITDRRARRYVFCGTVRSRAVASSAPWRYQARCPAVSGLSSRRNCRPAITQPTRRCHYRAAQALANRC